MSKVIKSVGYTIKSGKLYLQDYKHRFFAFQDETTKVKFGNLSEGFKLISFEDDAKKVAKSCDGEVIEVFLCDEGKSGEKTENED